MRELRGTSSQREMAEAIGIKQNAWARYESGGALPGVDILTRICRIHACSADWLLGLKDSCSDSQNNSVRAAPGAIAIGSSGNVVRGTIVAGGDAGHAPACAKCPYKKKLKALEKLIQQ